MSDTPTTCPICREFFMVSPLIQMEAVHIARREGESAAEAFVNERLETYHESHQEGDE